MRAVGRGNACNPAAALANRAGQTREHIGGVVARAAEVALHRPDCVCVRALKHYEGHNDLHY